VRNNEDPLKPFRYMFALEADLTDHPCKKRQTASSDNPESCFPTPGNAIYHGPWAERHRV